jgi:hypothetical protein
MNLKESNDQFKTLHLEILRTHAQFVKKHGEMGKTDEKISGNRCDGTMNREDVVNYTKALDEAYAARKRWAAAQLKYFQFIDENRLVYGSQNS